MTPRAQSPTPSLTPPALARLCSPSPSLAPPQLALLCSPTRRWLPCGSLCFARPARRWHPPAARSALRAQSVPGTPEARSALLAQPVPGTPEARSALLAQPVGGTFGPRAAVPAQPVASTPAARSALLAPHRAVPRPRTRATKTNPPCPGEADTCGLAKVVGAPGSSPAESPGCAAPRVDFDCATSAVSQPVAERGPSAMIPRLAAVPVQPAMHTPPLSGTPSVGIGVIGVGLIGAYHAANLARRAAGAHLVGLADPIPNLAEQTAARQGCGFWTRDYQDLLAQPEVEAVVIATPASYHVEAILAAAQAGKAIFCEKPLAHSLAEADRAVQAVRASGVPFQIGFQRRFDPGFARARALVDRGELGQIQLLRSVTRDPSLDQPERVPPWAIFLETLIHDFDVLRFLAGGAEPIEVYAQADALILPDWKSRGMLDTATATLRYDNGAMATADASFQAVYGYDVRAEVFGSQGMASVGEDVGPRLVHHALSGATRPRPHWFIELFDSAYLAELVHFGAATRAWQRARATGRGASGALAPSPVPASENAIDTLKAPPQANAAPAPVAAGLADARAALVLALAAVESAQRHQPVRIDSITG